MSDPARLRKCLHCRDGHIVLFTSVQACDQCFGSGVDLSDEALCISIRELNTMVRTCKFLAKRGIHTLGELIRAAASGQMVGCEEEIPLTMRDIAELLDRWGLSRILAGTDTVIPSNRQAKC